MSTSICNICLRTNVKPYTLDDELESFYEDLCNFDNERDAQFCAVCIFKLKKCVEFKKNCILAVKVFKNWKRQTSNAKPPKELLHKVIPNPLGVSNNTNRGIYQFQETLILTIPVYVNPENIKGNGNVNDSKTGILGNINSVKAKINPDIVNKEAAKSENKLIFNLKPKVTETNNEPKVTEVVILDDDDDDKTDCETDDNFNNDDSEVTTQVKDEKQLSVKDENGIEIDDSSDTDAADDEPLQELKTRDKSKKRQNAGAKSDLSDFASDSDDLIKEAMTIIKEKKRSIKRARRRGNYEENSNILLEMDRALILQELKSHIKKKVDVYGPIEGTEGNFIDFDKVLAKLDNYSTFFLKCLSSLCSLPGPFTPQTIAKLSQIQDRFNDIEKVFEITRVRDPIEMEEAFKKRATYAEYLKDPHPCEKCLKGFKHPGKLELHIKTKHDESLPYGCKLCHCRFKRFNRVQHHVASNHTLIFKCKLCPDFSTDGHGLMQAHFRKHEGFSKMCQECGIIYQSRSAYYNHMNSCHTGLNYVCPICASAYYNSQGLKAHSAMIHAREKFVESEDNVKCNICSIVFLNKDVYEKHVKISHNVTKRTNRLYMPRSKENPRKKTSSDEKSKCKLCDWTGSGFNARGRHHQREHQGVDYHTTYGTAFILCHLCGKGFNNSGVFKDHMNGHTGCRPHKCPKCGKGFYSHMQMTIHQQRHYPPKFKCQLCEKMFTTAVGLRCHLKSHVGDRQFKCQICGKRFLHAYSLKEHVNGVHLNIRRKRKRRDVDK